jgi:hypothetical protein
MALGSSLPNNQTHILGIPAKLAAHTQGENSDSGDSIYNNFTNGGNQPQGKNDGSRN